MAGTELAEDCVDFTGLTDTALIKHAANRQPEALQELFNRYQQMVYSTAVYLLKDHGAAEELTLSVFTWVWEQARNYQPGRAKVSTWLIMMTRNRAIDLLRRGKARRDAQHVAWSDAEMTPDPNNLEAEVEARSQQERLRNALAMLPSEQATTLGLAYFGGLTHQEIAERLGEPLGTVKTRIRLGLKKLRDHFKNP